MENEKKGEYSNIVKPSDSHVIMGSGNSLSTSITKTNYELLSIGRSGTWFNNQNMKVLFQQNAFRWVSARKT